jgi:hypothetical protein
MSDNDSISGKGNKYIWSIPVIYENQDKKITEDFRERKIVDANSPLLAMNLTETVMLQEELIIASYRIF